MEMSKGFYAMEKNIRPILLNALTSNKLADDDYLFKATANTVFNRIRERGELGGESFRNLCKLEAELVIRKFQLEFSEKDRNIYRDRIEIIQILIKEVLLLVKDEFNVKSDVEQTKLYELRQKEERAKEQYEIDRMALKNEITLVVLFIGFGLLIGIPTIIFFFK